MGGARLIRGWEEVENFVSNKATEDAAQKKKEGADTKKKELSEVQKKREAIQSLKQKSKRLTEEEKDSIQESHELDDYSNEEENEERTIDHLVLVIHGVGQKLGDRMEAINFIHDVNVMRRTMKDAAGAFIQQSTPTTKDSPGTDKAKESSKNPYAMPSGFGVQLLPIEWRRQITFGMANEDEELQRDLSTPDVEEGCPTMDDIMLDGVPTIRMLVSDVLMDGMCWAKQLHIVVIRLYIHLTGIITAIHVSMSSAALHDAQLQTQDDGGCYSGIEQSLPEVHSS